MRRRVGFPCTICLMCTLSTSVAVAQTYVTGTITTQTWYRASRPYRVTGTITVPGADTLTIEAGVDVLFDADVQFVVSGVLHAVGTPQDSIRFIKGYAPEWGGIRIRGPDSTTIGYARISGADADGSLRPDDDRGGGIYLSTGTRLGSAHTVISGNSAGWGGGVHNSNATLTMTNCTISGNSARYGGGVSNHDSATLTMTNCSITGNWALRDGGGLRTDGRGTLTMTNCTVSGNSARYGGGVYNSNSPLTMTNCTVSGNSASYDGGGVTISSDTVRMTDCAITGNSAGASGGGVNGSATLTMANCTVSGNSAGMSGGGVRNTNSPLTMTDCTVSGNSAGEYGGGVLFSYGALTMTNCTVRDNSAFRGGGLSVDDNATLTMATCTVSGSTAYQGAGVYTSSSALTMTNCTLGGNSAEGSGGGAHNENSTVTMRNCILWGNTGFDGAQIYQNSGTLTVRYSGVQGETRWAGVGNINADPRFVDAASGDYHLQWGSPCIDSGDPNSPLDPGGTRADMGAFPFPHSVAVSLSPAPVPFSLSQNAPNPFNPSTTIRFGLPEAGIVHLSVYGATGQLVRTLVDATVEAGTHEVVWDGRDHGGRACASGVYLYRLTSSHGTVVRRMALLR